MSYTHSQQKFKGNFFEKKLINKNKKLIEFNYLKFHFKHK